MKKILCILTAVVMLMAFSACGSKSVGENTSPTDVSSEPTSPSDIEIPEETVAPDPQPVSALSICGIPIVTNSQLTGIAYTGAVYEDGVLTLDGADMLADYGSTSAIYFVGDLEIVIKGENTITAENGACAIEGAQADDGSLSNLTISGDGSLVMRAVDTYGLSCSGTVTVTGVSLDITGGEAAVEGGSESLTLGDGLTVTGDTGARITVG